MVTVLQLPQRGHALARLQRVGALGMSEVETPGPEAERSASTAADSTSKKMLFWLRALASACQLGSSLLSSALSSGANYYNTLPLIITFCNL